MYAAIEQAIETARQHIPITKSVVKEEAWCGFTIVRKVDPYERESFHAYKADAWERPSETPLLPWSPPTGTPVADVDMSGNVTYR